jgi:hypothetical protein
METTVTPGRRQGSKGPTRHTAAISEENEANREQHQRVQLGTAIAFAKRKIVYESVSVQIANQKAGSYVASRKIRRLQIAKRTARSTVRMRKIKKWTTWRGRPPPKRKKKLQIQQETVM